MTEDSEFCVDLQCCSRERGKKMLMKAGCVRQRTLDGIVRFALRLERGRELRELGVRGVAMYKI